MATAGEVYRKTYKTRISFDHIIFLKAFHYFMLILKRLNNNVNAEQ